jgi:hypothetical protein
MRWILESSVGSSFFGAYDVYGLDDGGCWLGYAGGCWLVYAGDCWLGSDGGCWLGSDDGCWLGSGLGTTSFSFVLAMFTD